MRHLLILLVGLLAFASCKKEDEPAPVASARVSGTYELTRFAFDSVGTAGDFDLTLPVSNTLTKTTLSGTMDVKQFNNRDDAVTILVTLKLTGSQDSPLDLEDFELTGTGSTLDLTYNGQKYGTADGTNIELTLPAQVGTYRFVARRR